MATNDYWIDIVPPKGAYGSKVGLDVYEIQPHRVGGDMTSMLGKGHHHHGYGGRRDGIPLFYTVDYGLTPVITDTDDYEIPDNISGADVIARAGWTTPTRDLTREWAAKWKRAPNAAQDACLRRLAARNQSVFSFEGHRAPSREDQMNFNTAQFLINFYLQHGRGPDNGDPATGVPGRPETNALIKAATGAVPSSKGLVGDIVHAANNAASFAGKALALPGQVVSKIPIIGKPLRSALNINPLTAMGGLVASVAHGERLDRALLETAKHEINNVREIAPYAKMVASMVPGIGSGVAAAMAAGVALSEGRTITDAVKEAVISAVPGGAIGKAVANAAVSIAQGGNVGAAAMNAAISQLPPNAQQAAQTAIAIAKGKNVKVAVLNAVRSSLPPEAQKALDIGTAIAVGSNVQSAVVKELLNPKSLALLTKVPVPAQLARAIPKAAEAAEGYKAAIGLLQHSGVTAHAIAALREKLPASKQAGFDHGVKTYMHQFTKDTHSSLVRGGVVTRGNWRTARAGEKGIPGRLIKGNKVTHGNYVRV